MMLNFFLFLAVIASATPTLAASNGEGIGIDHEEWRVIGWNDGCGVALKHLSYPRLGEAMIAEPVQTRIGTLEIAPGEEVAHLNSVYEADGALSWDPAAVKKAESQLKKGGFIDRGYLETIRDAPIGRQPQLAETILSTGTLSPRLKVGWPGPDWRWAGASYNSLSTCALLAFENRQSRRRYRFLLVRVYNTRARLDRAYAHASNGRLLFNDGDLENGAPEAETAAQLAPELPIARYEHAAMLALTGRLDEAVVELSFAVKLDPLLGKKARTDVDFSDLKRRDDFKDATR